MYRHIKYSCKKNKDEDLQELVKLMNEKLHEQNSKIESMENQIEKRDKQIIKLSLTFFMIKIEVYKKKLKSSN